jgi:hypothetical protein
MKPTAYVIGEDGNVFNTLSICSRALKDADMRAEAEEMKTRVFAAESYDEALRIMSEYVELA